jgi:anaerobic selenocysteine-containing dehydrogenase/Fe-S-cluster-containing dehydrogenase component
MSVFSRRDFLKGLTLTGTAASLGCSSESARKLIPYIIPPEDIIPGEATWYATTCRECPAGCGLLAKNRDGRVIKVEGNPLHPVNEGKLCPRGQASVQGIYHPDRYRGPLRKNPKGVWESISWETGEELLLAKLREVKENGRGERLVFLSELITGAQKNLIGRWLAEVGAVGPLLYEPLAYEPLRRANQAVFGQDRIPMYGIDRADFLLSFGANFLEAWLSDVQYARQFASFRTPRDKGKNLFIYVGPRYSVTAANADYWIAVSPDHLSLVASGLLRILLAKNSSPSLRKELRSSLEGKLKDFSLETVQSRTGMKAETLQELARKISAAQRPLVLASGLAFGDSKALDTCMAANLLNLLSGKSSSLLAFEDPSSLGDAIRAEDMKELTQRMFGGEVEILLINRSNPVFHLPPSWEFQKALQKVPLVVSFSSLPDETSELANLILPSPTFLEAWGDYQPRKSVEGLIQPVMGPMFDTRPMEDLLISAGRKLAGEKKFPWKNFYEMLRQAWAGKAKKPGASSEAFWQESLQKGGTWGSPPPSSSKPLLPAAGLNFFPSAPTAQGAGKQFHFVVYPTIQFFDGRSSSRPFLQELPDPLTQVTWGGWVEINPQTARKRGIEKGDLVILRSSHGTVKVPAFPYPGIPAGVLAMPLGQGHTTGGRFVPGGSEDPVKLISPDVDASCKGLRWALSEVTLEKAGGSIPLANVDGSFYQHGRNIAQAISWQEYQDRKSTGKKPAIRLPLPEDFSRKDDFYQPHQHVDYRWVMVVDLDRCIGCGACVVACYAENNLAVVGRKRVLDGREMSWLRIERYFDPDRTFVRFLPMLCQHCDAAPCESVCPIFAPHHSKEGINNQVYNRCIGTRFCSQNCPYKVRRFNWFTYERHEPLNWQLNPDVTVRHKGVMEKCSFCIQRIVEAKVRARSEGRKVRDGDFTTACAQTCPAGALTFGNLLDPESRVSKLIRDPRAYQVLEQLNTKPAVIYLKKITLDSIFSLG